MNFEELLTQAQLGSEAALEEILARYRPLLVKHSICDGFFDEDLYQELCMTILNCIRNFKIISKI